MLAGPGGEDGDSLRVKRFERHPSWSMTQQYVVRHHSAYSVWTLPRTTASTVCVLHSQIPPRWHPAHVVSVNELQMEYELPGSALHSVQWQCDLSFPWTDISVCVWLQHFPHFDWSSSHQTVSTVHQQSQEDIDLWWLDEIYHNQLLFNAVSLFFSLTCWAEEAMAN